MEKSFALEFSDQASLEDELETWFAKAKP